MCPKIQIARFSLDTFLLLYLLAFAVSIVLLLRLFHENKLSDRLFFCLIFWCTVGGMIGSKLYFCLENWRFFVNSPVDTFFHASGSGWYGAFLGGLLAAILVFRHSRLPVLTMLDILIIPIPLAQAIGRIGCFCAGCCLGKLTDLPWGVAFPDGVVPMTSPVHPTQLYEMMLFFIVFVFLWHIREKKTAFPGRLFGIYLVMAGAGRFLIEFLRVNPRFLGPFTLAHLSALASAAAGFALILRAGAK